MDQKIFVILTKFRINRYSYNKVMFIAVHQQMLFLLKSERLNWKNWMVKGTNYIILTATLHIKKQM